MHFLEAAYRVGFFKEITWMRFALTCYSFGVCDYYHSFKMFFFASRVIYDSYFTDEHRMALLYSLPYSTLEIKTFTGHLYLQFFIIKICVYDTFNASSKICCRPFGLNNEYSHFRNPINSTALSKIHENVGYLLKSGLLNQLMYFDYLISQIDVKFNAMQIYTVHVKCLTVMKLAYFSCPTKTDFINIMCANWFL